MRVGMLIWTFWPGPEGGAERQCRQIIPELSQQGSEIIVFTSKFRYFSSSSSNYRAYKERRFGLLCPLTGKIQQLIAKVLIVVLGSGLEVNSRAILFWLMLPLEWLSRLLFLALPASWRERCSRRCPGGITAGQKE